MQNQPKTDAEWHLYKFGSDDYNISGETLCKVCGYPWDEHAGHHCSRKAEEMGMNWTDERFVPIDMPTLPEPIVISALPLHSTVRNVFNEE